jgi:hypothetical protein
MTRILCVEGAAVAAALMAALKDSDVKVLTVEDVHLADADKTDKTLKDAEMLLVGIGETFLGPRIAQLAIEKWELPFVEPTMAASPQRSEFRQLRQQSRHQMARRQQSLQATARRR